MGIFVILRNIYGYFCYIDNRHRFWGVFFKLIFFSKGHFSNLPSKKDVVLYFPSNLTVLTNRVAKLQLFDNFGVILSLFEHYGTKMKMTDSLKC
jgi:hypothetical protein